MSHFNKLRAPLFSIHEFPSLAEQEQRFINAGWAQARARSLWDLWSDDNFLPASTRIGLDSFEAFDEWEEFALFASHYFLLVASNNPGPAKESTTSSESTSMRNSPNPSEQFVLEAHFSSGRSARRRYGALVPDTDHSVGHHGGQGEQTRLASTDLYTRSGESTGPTISFPSRDIPARMCHTITPLGVSNDCLLVGGRTSPTAPLGDCWLRYCSHWRQVHPLPEARFRHCAASVTLGKDSSSVVVYGGKTKENAILDSWLLWNEKDEQGWQPVQTSGGKPEARFGACFAKIQENFGVLFGGVGSTGTIIEDFWTWSLSRRDDGFWQVELTDLTKHLRDASPQLSQYLSRFGATVTPTSLGLVVAGGIMPRQLVPAEKEILLLDSKMLLDSAAARTFDAELVSAIGLGRAFNGQKPLLTGHIACAVDDDQVLFVGGGAVCFSFGTFWTEGTWTLQTVDSKEKNTWAVSAPKKDLACKTPGRSVRNSYQSNPSTNIEPAQIPRTRIESAAQFQQLVANGKPVVIEGSDIGPCTQLWTKEYLTSAVGADRKVRQLPGPHDSGHAD